MLALRCKDEKQEPLLRCGRRVVPTTCRQFSDDRLGSTVRVCHHRFVIRNHNLTVSLAVGLCSPAAAGRPLMEASLWRGDSLRSTWKDSSPFVSPL